MDSSIKTFSNERAFTVLDWKPKTRTSIAALRTLYMYENRLKLQARKGFSMPILAWITKKKVLASGKFTYPLQKQGRATISSLSMSDIIHFKLQFRHRNPKKHRKPFSILLAISYVWIYAYDIKLLKVLSEQQNNYIQICKLFKRTFVNANTLIKKKKLLTSAGLKIFQEWSHHP